MVQKIFLPYMIKIYFQQPGLSHSSIYYKVAVLHSNLCT